jgi:hypothetical protein
MDGTVTGAVSTKSSVDDDEGSKFVSVIVLSGFDPKFLVPLQP